MTFLSMEVFDICKIDQASAEFHVSTSGPSGALGWRTTKPPARGTKILVTIVAEETAAKESNQ